MELKHYLKVFLQRWWLIAVALAVTVGMTLIYTSRQPWVYESEATFVVRPRVIEGADAVKATDTLIRGAEINSTFAAIAGSDNVKDRAVAAIGEETTKGQALSVGSDVVAGTNILRITVSGRDAQVVKDYADAVSDEAVSYIDALNDVYQLVPLDPPKLAEAPAGPNKAATNVLGVIVGLMLGAVLAFIAEYLSESGPEVVTFEILDPETGVYNEAYFRRRFDEEMSRARHTGLPFTLTMVQSALTPGGEDRGGYDEVAKALGTIVRPEDVLAHLGDGTFGLIMAGLTETEAEQVMADWAVSTWPDNDGVPPPDSSFTVSLGVCEYGGDELPAPIRAI